MEQIQLEEVTNCSQTLSTGSNVVGPDDNESLPVQGMHMDFTHDFETHEYFSSREALFDWARARGKEHGFVVIIGRSDKGFGNKTPRLLLTCERSGQYREKKIVLKSSQETNEDETVEQTDRKKTKRKREFGSKKCGCSFSLKGRQVNSLGEWELYVVCGVHNHPTEEHYEGHSYAGRLLKPEEEYVTGMSRAKSKPKEILFALKQKFVDNKSTIRTIYNARMKNRANVYEDQSQMQQLIQKLEEHGYYHLYRRCEKTHTIKDLFFSNPESIDLLRAFPYVILMDSTNKTNRYKLPLLEIVGVTSTNIPFLIAAVYLEFDREDNYEWACSILKSLMDESVLPNVIVTVKEIALMNAIENTFPSSRNLLSRWHISINILVNCKKLLRSEERWATFNLNWNLLVIASTESKFNDMVSRLSKDFCEFPDAVKVESQHVLLKKQLGSSHGNFETWWQQIHTIIKTSYMSIKDSFDKSKFVVQSKFKSSIFWELRGMVSLHALKLMFDEMNYMDESGVDVSSCRCVMRKTCGIPCSHELTEFVRLESPIPLEKVHPFWRKLDRLPVTKDVISVEDELVIQMRECLTAFKLKFDQATAYEKELLLKRLREIMNPTTPTNSVNSG